MPLHCLVTGLTFKQLGWCCNCSAWFVGNVSIVAHGFWEMYQLWRMVYGKCINCGTWFMGNVSLWCMVYGKCIKCGTWFMGNVSIVVHGLWEMYQLCA